MAASLGERYLPQPGMATETIALFSTDAMPPRQRMEYWHHSVLRRLDVQARPGDQKHFKATLLRLSGHNAELVQHSADSLVAERGAKRCQGDGCDDIAIDFIAVSTRASLNHAGIRQLQAGNMVVVDCAQPLEINRARHRVISLFIPRAQVRAVCADPAALAGSLLPSKGFAKLLRGHMLKTMDEAMHLFPAQRTTAIAAARDMALSILQLQALGGLDTEQFATGIYHAAHALITRQCTSPKLTPQLVAIALGCSRAALYRAFANANETVSTAIWAARLAHAAKMLHSAACANLLISEISFRSGFADHSTFDRMFKRTHDMTPGDMRNKIGAPREEKGEVLRR